jgi:hypothetical protein
MCMERRSSEGRLVFPARLSDCLMRRDTSAASELHDLLTVKNTRSPRQHVNTCVCGVCGVCGTFGALFLFVLFMLRFLVFLLGLLVALEGGGGEERRRDKTK